MAQSIHHRPDSLTGELQRPACRTSGSASHPHPNLPAYARHSFGATGLPITAIGGPRIMGVRAGVGQTRR